MAMDSRDWLFMGLGFGIGFLILTSIGRRAIMTGIGVTKAETERLLSKIEKKAKARAKIE